MIIFNLILWAAWRVYWSATGTVTGPKRWMVKTESVSQAFSWMVLIYSGFALMHVDCQPTGRWSGCVFVVLGLVLSIYSRSWLGRQWTERIGIRNQHQLIREGPYGFVRHPMYSGLILASAGTALTIGTQMAMWGFALMFAGFMVKASREECFLEDAFSVHWRWYKIDVPWRLVPGLF